VFSRHHRKVRILFALADLVLGTLAFEAAYLTRSQLQLYHFFEIVGGDRGLLLGFSLTVLVLTGVWFRLYYQLDSAPLSFKLRETTRQSVITVIAVVLFEYALRLDLSRPFLFFFGSYLWVLLALFRLRAGSLAKWFGSPHYMMIVGTGESARRIAQTIEQSADYGMRLSGFIEDSVNTNGRPRVVVSNYPVHPLTDLPKLLDQHIIDELIFAVDSKRLAELEDVFLLCDEEGVRTRVACDFFPHMNSEVYLDRLGHAPLLTFSAAPHDELRLFVKRLTDILIASASLVLLAPVMLLLGLLVRITSPGPALFKQIRCGLNGRRFTFYKFRSMCENAEDLKETLTHLNERSEVVFKIRNDPRLTPVGKWLRKFSLDELPQLWNVLRGDMSIVGPRPPVPEEVQHYERWQRRRLRMRPGLTCIWAISGRDAVDFETWMKMDMQYIDNWSLALDWKIMIQTVPRVLTGRGAS
jgi:exopolysaccharide biosynthesis polyprenyl glycosylphosphotransferase